MLEFVCSRRKQHGRIEAPGLDSSDEESSGEEENVQDMLQHMRRELDEAVEGFGLEDEASDTDDQDADNSADPPDVGAEVEIAGEEDRGFRWRKRDRPTLAVPFTNDFSDPPEELFTPYQYFKMFLDDDMFSSIAEQTNLYSTQTAISEGRDNPFSVNESDMEQFVGILMLMGVVKFPSYRMYWSMETIVPMIADCMSRNTFEKVMKHLHFNDNDKMLPVNDPNRDRIFKVRPFLAALRNNCLKLEPEEKHSVDEMIIPTKTRWGIRQYNPKKPNKWGVKVWARCGVSGMLYDFDVYTGAQAPNAPAHAHVAKYGASAAPVRLLCDTLPKNANHKVFCDNYFSNVELFVDLMKDGIYLVGTVRPNRLRGAQNHLASGNELKKRGRGSYDWTVDANSGLCVVRWQDSGTVNVMSTFVGSAEGEPARRWSAKDRDYIEIPRPAMICEYNTHMGGVDLADMLVALYRVRIGVKKSYKRLFLFGIDISAVNAWLLHRRHATQMGIATYPTFLQFRMDIVRSLLKAGKDAKPRGSKVGRPRRSDSLPNNEPVCKRGRVPVQPMPTPDIRFDNVGHFPVFLEKQAKCAYCIEKGEQRPFKTFMICSKCNKALCLVRDRNCFKDFHAK